MSSWELVGLLICLLLIVAQLHICWFDFFSFDSCTRRLSLKSQTSKIGFLGFLDFYFLFNVDFDWLRSLGFLSRLEEGELEV